MEKLKSMKCQLECLVEEQLMDTDAIDAEELGEVIDMIKDIAETMYYCTIVEAMEKANHKVVPAGTAAPTSMMNATTSVI